MDEKMNLTVNSNGNSNGISNENLIVFTRTDLNNILDLIGINNKEFCNRINISHSVITYISKGRNDWNKSHLQNIVNLIKENKSVISKSSKVILSLISNNYEDFCYCLKTEKEFVPIMNKRFKIKDTYTSKLKEVKSKNIFNKLIELNEDTIRSLFKTINNIEKIIYDIEFYISKYN